MITDKIPAWLKGPLGKRLLTAFSGLTVLTLLTGAVALFAWFSQGSDLETILDESVPAIRESAVLEQQGAYLQTAAAQLAGAAQLSGSQDLAEIALDQQQLTRPLAQITAAAARLSAWHPKEGPALQADAARTREVVDALAQAIQQRQMAEKALRTLQMRLQWLHADFQDELQTQIQDQAWLLNEAMQKPSQQSQMVALVKRNNLLQQLFIQEQALYQRLREMIRPREEPTPREALQKRNKDAETLIVLARQLPREYAATLQPILQDIRTLSQPHAELGEALTLYADSNQAVQQALQQLTEQISQLHARAEALSRRSNQEAKDAFARLARQSERGKVLILASMGASILLISWILFWQLGNKMFARLGMLGRNIAALGQRQLVLPEVVEGRDEIGQLGHQLTALAQEMAEIERTNALKLINNTEAALLICGPLGIVRSINQAAQRMVPGLACGGSLQALLGDYAFPRLLEQRAEDECLDLVLELGSSEDRHYCRLLARSIAGNDPQHIITLLDITAQMRSANWLQERIEEKTFELDAMNQALRLEIDERKRAQDSLVQATKLAVLGQTMTSLAHELNQPLAALTNYLYLARNQQRNADHAALEGSLEQSEKLVGRMAKLIRSFRTIGQRPQPLPNLTAIDLGVVISDVLVLLASRIDSQRVTLLQPDDDSWPQVLGEVVRLEQIILNLLSNALDAVRDRDDAQIEIYYVHADRRVELMVCDNGIGFPPKAMETLFQPFHTTKQDGLGLGLSISQSLAQECRGELRAASGIHGGALLILSLEESPC